MPRASRRAGFTVLEILMVMALIGIMAGLAITRVGFVGFRMDANIRLLQNAIIGAQQLAIQRNTHVQVMFDANEHRLRIVQDFNNNGVMDGGDSVRYRPLADGAEFQAPPTTIDGATPAYVTGPGRVDTGNPMQAAIRIAPNGSLSGDVVVYIGSSRQFAEDWRALTIIGATSRTGFWSHATGSWRQRDN